MRDFGDFFGLAFSALLPLISPLCSAFLFQGLAGGLSGAVYRIFGVQDRDQYHNLPAGHSSDGNSAAEVLWDLPARHAGGWRVRAGGNGLEPH